MTDLRVARQPTDEAPAQRPMSPRTAAIWSLCGHLVVIGAAVGLGRVAVPPAMPPSYSVELVAAPAGTRALGAVDEGPTTPSQPAVPPSAALPAPTPTPSVAPSAAPKPPAVPTPKPTAVPPRATTPATPPVPRAGADVRRPGSTAAGGGPTGGRGADVANVRVQGIDFPFPGYLQNITRQIALNFKPQAGVALRTDVTFMIHRDGSVSDLRIMARSGAYAFDLEAVGAVEAVGKRKAFGPLPAAFSDDVLQVVFSFDPRVMR